MTDLPPWPGGAQPGTEAWARIQLATLPHQQAALDIVAVAALNHFSLEKARVHYAMVSVSVGWTGHEARSAWAIIEALVTAADPLQGDIPF